MEKEYICPHCNEKQTSICQWQTASVGSELNMEDGSWEQKDIVGGDHEAWVCPGCEHELDPLFVDTLKLLE